MKTAMQELIEKLAMKSGDSFHAIAFYHDNNDIIKEALEKEKEQILNAYQQGNGDAGWLEDKYEPQEYYNQTYNQNK